MTPYYSFLSLINNFLIYNIPDPKPDLYKSQEKSLTKPKTSQSTEKCKLDPALKSLGLVALMDNCPWTIMFFD
ncbi:hypothetical protein BpHYR1_022634 [Brachionus plicatilis]|uniref:Uncharacterized protein n=1 Tax=Brachionus plicatilis TaxID=10195 RepID=A0A3M7PBT8_BRAPC|nr:hypothetical protein BpHYR1_022634 [Brachionus plicatilis]